MKTDIEQLRSLKSRLLDTSASSEVTLPAAFVMGLVEDVEELREGEEQLDNFCKRLDQLEAGPPAKPRLVVLHGGGEEDVFTTTGGDAA